VGLCQWSNCGAKLAKGNAWSQLELEEKKWIMGADLLGLGNVLTCVTTVTDRTGCMGETSIVNMVQRASKKVLLEPGDTELQWKGEAAASFVCAGITSSRVLPTSSADYWSPFIILFSYKASEETLSFGGFFLF
jgi:hypothetical protein